MNLPLQPGERDVLVETIDEWLDSADDVERDMYADKSIEDPVDFLSAMTSHTDRTRKLRELRERLLHDAA